jgi:hypothetical protein
MFQCQPADQALVDRLDAALQVRGAYVSNLYVAPAGELEGSLPALGSPWWAAGRINGAGAQPEVGVWAWDGSASDACPTVLSANASAVRYFPFSAVDPQLASASPVVAALLACVGPLPEP